MIVNVTIEIEDKYTLPFCESFEIKTSKTNYSDTANVVLPIPVPDIKVGDKIVIYSGYDANLVPYFTGYVSEVLGTSKTILNCEDIAFKYKLEPVEATTFENKDVNLDAVLKHCIKGGKYKCISANLGKIKISENNTLIDVLDELKKTYYLESYFQDDVLYCGFELKKEPETTILCIVNGRDGNVILGTDNLEKVNTDEKNIVSYGVSTQKDGTKYEIYYYYDGETVKESTEKPKYGTINTIEIAGISLADLKEYTKRRLIALYKTGIRGEITTFGEPKVKHGDNIEIQDHRFPEREGEYRIIGVDYSLSVSNGLKQKIYIGFKLA